MSPDERAKALAHYIADALRGDRGEFIRRAKVSKGRVTQYLQEGFGERAARALERKLHLARGTLDHAPRAGSEDEIAQKSAGSADREPIPTVEEMAMDVQRQIAELVRAWLSLDEADRNRFKRELEAKSLQHRDPARDGTRSIERYASAAHVKKVGTQ